MGVKVGQKVEVTLSKDWVMIIAIKEDVIVCRTKTNEIIEFYPFELQEIK